MKRFRWWLFGWLAKHNATCVANSYQLVIEGERVDPRIGWSCRYDLANNGVCWCGKLRTAEHGMEKAG